MTTDSDIRTLFEDSLSVTPETIEFIEKGVEESAIVETGDDKYVIKIHNKDMYNNPRMFLAGPALMEELPETIPVPEVYTVCDDIESLIGTPYYIMEFIEGFHLDVGSDTIDEDLHTSIIEQSATILSELRQVDVEVSGVGWLKYTYTGDLETGGAAMTMDEFVSNQLYTEYIPSISKQYAESGRFSDSVSSITEIADAISEVGVEPTEIGVCHRDYKYDNMLVDSGDVPIRGVIDWDMPMYVDSLFNVVKAEWNLIDEKRMFGEISNSRSEELKKSFREVYGDYMDSDIEAAPGSVGWRETVYQFLFVLEAIEGFSWWFEDLSETEKERAAEFYRSEVDRIAAEIL